jgi:HEPN domain-containing protein
VMARQTIAELMTLITDWPWLNVKAEALIDAANAFEIMGDRPAAIDHARQALELTVQKKNIALGRQVDALLTRLGV